MKLSVIALDYDGTVARNDVLDPSVRRAIAEARARRIVVLLVTGRRLDDLRRVAGDLHFVDAVVAENGGVLYFPVSGYIAPLAGPPPAGLLHDLATRGIPHASGQSLVEADATDAPAVLDIIRSRGLPISLVFNHGRLMMLGQSISKATGLREALAILRLSPHSAVAIGDAENDHELLRVCEVGAAVAWGSESLRRVADLVIEGSGPPAVATYLDRLVQTGKIPQVLPGRRRLMLGYTDEGEMFDLAIRGRNVLVAGDARSGKSWVAGLLAEQLILHRYSVCVIDPEGDYRPLDALPGVLALGGADPLPRPHELLRALRHAETSVVIDLSHLHHQDKVEYTRALLPSLARLRRGTGLPHRVVLDEAHYFLGDGPADGLLDLEQNGYTLVTYRASHLSQEVLDASEVVIVTCESNPEEVVALHAACRSTEGVETWISALAGLAIGEAAVLPGVKETGSILRRIHLSPRLTHHVRHREKYVDIPVPESRAFVFTRNGKPVGQPARTLRALVAVLEADRQDYLEGHARRGDFSRWVADMFGDHQLANAIRLLEQRCCHENYPNAVPAIGSTIRGRYDLAEESLFSLETAPAGALASGT
jgi:hydroxymethylpyrimidine pyrophosphatase-like HAD family hydrolase